jgi:hypothetical protein
MFLEKYIQSRTTCTWYHNPRREYLHNHCCENLKYHVLGIAGTNASVFFGDFVEKYRVYPAFFILLDIYVEAIIFFQWLFQPIQGFYPVP